MLLSARLLIDVVDVNHFRYTPVIEFTEGDGPVIYFQLIDASVDKENRPSGRRYIPASGAILQCVVHHIDDAKKVTRFATQPFSTDTSIWALTMQPTDQVRGTSELLLTLTEGIKVTTGRLGSAINIYAKVQGV